MHDVWLRLTYSAVMWIWFYLATGTLLLRWFLTAFTPYKFVVFFTFVPNTSYFCPSTWSLSPTLPQEGHSSLLILWGSVGSAQHRQRKGRGINSHKIQAFTVWDNLSAGLCHWRCWYIVLCFSALAVRGHCELDAQGNTVGMQHTFSDVGENVQKLYVCITDFHFQKLIGIIWYSCNYQVYYTRSNQGMELPCIKIHFNHFYIWNQCVHVVEYQHEFHPILLCVIIKADSFKGIICVWKYCNHVKPVFENSYSGLVTISPVKDFFICLKMYNSHTKLHQLWSDNSKKRTCRCASHTLRRRRTCIDNPRVCDGDSWGASACFGTGWHSCTDARLRRSDGPFWARLSKQTERVSGETEVPQRQPGKSEPDLPGERGREQTGFISLFLIPLTRLTGSTAAVSADSMSARMGTEEILKIYVCQTFLFCL